MENLNIGWFDIQSLLSMLKVIFFGIIWFFWIWSIIWVAVDISRRSDSLLLQVISILIATFWWPVIWLMIYFLIRPPYYLYDKSWRRDVIINYSIECVNCGELNPKDYNNCIRCWDKLKTKCKQCSKEFAKRYEYCPWCGGPNI